MKWDKKDEKNIAPQMSIFSNKRHEIILLPTFIRPQTQ